MSGKHYNHSSLIGTAIWVGDIRSSDDEAFLMNEKIDIIINVSGRDLDNVPEHINIYDFGMADTELLPQEIPQIINKLENIVKIIVGEHTTGHRILICSLKGVNRAHLVMGYWMKANGSKYEDIIVRLVEANLNRDVELHTLTNKSFRTILGKPTSADVLSKNAASLRVMN